MEIENKKKPPHFVMDLANLTISLAEQELISHLNWVARKHLQEDSKYQKEIAQEARLEALKELNYDKRREEILKSSSNTASLFSPKKWFDTVTENHKNWNYTHGTKAYEEEGPKKAFSLKNPTVFNGDCNDACMTYINACVRESKGLIPKEIAKQYAQGRATYGAAGMAEVSIKMNEDHPFGKHLRGKEITASKVEAGDIIFFPPLSKEQQERVKDRPLGIGHIAYVVEHNGKKYVEEFAGRKSDFRRVELSQYLKEKGRYDLHVTTLFPDVKATMAAKNTKVNSRLERLENELNEEIESRIASRFERDLEQRTALYKEEYDAEMAEFRLAQQHNVDTAMPEGSLLQEVAYEQQRKTAEEQEESLISKIQNIFNFGN